MTSYEFEKAAKNAVIKVMRKQGVHLTLEALQFVWFAHTLGNKKCALYSPGMLTFYAEVTYNAAEKEMYVDVYVKHYNTQIPESDFDFCAAKGKEENSDEH